jgi:TonB-linked SusC/RagA family outer membrane protein
MPSLRPVAALLTLAALSASPVLAQSTGLITGLVTDSASSLPLVGVQVSIAGTRLLAQTGTDGRYTIGNVPFGVHVVDARRIGYQPAVTRNVRVDSSASVTVDFRMRQAVLTLEAVISTGVVDPTAGTRVPFTVGRVDATALPVPATNALESIQGKMSGVTVAPPGQAGSGTNILLRVPTSISKSNSPLIVVDGVIQSSAFGASSADLEALDIESIEVVKGAAAASLYGSRAQSGVIQIKTRRGGAILEGSTLYTLRSEVGRNSLGGKIDWASRHYYRTNAAGEYVNAVGTVVPRSGRVERPVYERFQDVPYLDPVYDQVDRFFDPGDFSKQSINIAQNGPRTNWFLSVNDSREDGVVLNSGKYAQRDVRLNLDHRPSDILSFSASGFHSSSDRHELYGDTFFDLINQAPDIDLLVPDPDGTPYAFQTDPTGREENPLYVLATEKSRRKRARSQGSLEAKFQPFGWLTLDGNASYDRSDRRDNFFLDQGLKTEGFAQGGLGEIEQATGTTQALNAAVSANVLGAFGPFTLRSTLRGLTEREQNLVTEAEGSDLAVPGVPSLDNARTRFVSSELEEIRSTGVFLSAGADYRGTYIADALFRRDGSSLFGPNERWNSYYRVSGAYRLTEEPWWPLDDFTELKLRLSRGTAGGRPSFDDQYETFSFSAAGGVLKQTLGNADLKPELATETEVGVDAIIRDNYSVQLSYAQVKVEDQLLLVPLAALFGYTSQWRNAGTVEGNTLEGTLEARIIRRPDLTWTLGLVVDRSRHSITEFDLPCFTTNTIAFRCAGVGLGEMFGFSFAKRVADLPAGAQPFADQFDVNDEGLVVWVGPGRTYRDGVQPADTSGWGNDTSLAGVTYRWGMPIVRRDAAGNNLVTRIGDGNPRYRWSLSNAVTWRSFDLYGLLDVKVGGHNYNQTNQRMYQWARSGDVDQTGKPEELKKPIEYYVALYAANDPTDYFVENAGYVKLRELSLRYRFGGRILDLLQGFGARSGSFSLIGRNLMTWTDYKGYDPEIGGTIVKLDSFDYPRYRTITGTLSLTF